MCKITLLAVVTGIIGSRVLTIQSELLARRRKGCPGVLVSGGDTVRCTEIGDLHMTCGPDLYVTWIPGEPETYAVKTGCPGYESPACLDH